MKIYFVRQYAIKCQIQTEGERCYLDALSASWGHLDDSDGNRSRDWLDLQTNIVGFFFICFYHQKTPALQPLLALLLPIVSLWQCTTSDCGWGVSEYSPQETSPAHWKLAYQDRSYAHPSTICYASSSEVVQSSKSLVTWLCDCVVQSLEKYEVFPEGFHKWHAE